MSSRKTQMAVMAVLAWLTALAIAGGVACRWLWGMAERFE